MGAEAGIEILGEEKIGKILYLSQRRKDAKFGILFKGFLSDENL
jgi:hypothetical protein